MDGIVSEERLRGKLRDGIRRIFARKGDAIVEANIKAFDAGLLLSQKDR